MLLIYVFQATTGSEFEEFSAFLGEKIRLKGWEKFRGGLDVKSNFLLAIFFFLKIVSLKHDLNLADTTGIYSIYASIEHEWSPKTDNFEIMVRISKYFFKRMFKDHVKQVSCFYNASILSR